MKRSSGVLMPMFSLPSPYGIGTMGKAAYDFVDFLSRTRQKYWQLLPLGPAGCGNSPYTSYSSFAGESCYIDLDMLVTDGLIEEAELSPLAEYKYGRYVDYETVRTQHGEILRLAFKRGIKKFPAEFESFRHGNSSWLENYSLYMALRDYFGAKGWTEWEDDGIRLHTDTAVEAYRLLLSEAVDFYAFTQFLFYRQWFALKSYAAQKGISFVGDVPIYVALDSADVWGERQFFLLDEDGFPSEVSGVPPDAFTAEGQLWGNPLYDYDAMRADGFGWWIRRIDGARRLYDVIRIDHFRGFESYWSVPVSEKTAINGHWVKGPGMALVGVLTSWFYSLNYIAEDLGIITDDVRALLKDSGLPGMKVLQFAFDASSRSLYLPHNCNENSVCYIGTHDNNTVMGWLRTESAENLAFAKAYMHITEDEGWCWGMIRTGMSTASSLFIVQMQDLLELDESCRTNTPGTVGENWRWRMEKDAITSALEKKLLSYTEIYARA